jgi:outer membrane biosynthesis protein TonB
VLLIFVLATLCCAVKQEATSPQRAGTSELQPVYRVYNPPSGDRNSEPLPPEHPPVPLIQELPTYPPEALPSEIACTAYLLYHTEMDGTATFVRVDWIEPPPDDFLAAFESAVERAVQSWEFEPAFKIVPTEMDDGAIEPVIKKIRFASRARIRFMVVDGVGVVAR